MDLATSAFAAAELVVASLVLAHVVRTVFRDPNAARDREAEIAAARARHRADQRRRDADRANEFACLRRIRAGAPKRGGGPPWL